MNYKIGQKVFKRGKLYGTIAGIDETGGGILTVALARARYTGSDERDDAGIAAGTKCRHGLVSFAQIQDDPAMQVPTFVVS
jgi:hypothetical protein